MFCGINKKCKWIVIVFDNGEKGGGDIPTNWSVT